MYRRVLAFATVAALFTPAVAFAQFSLPGLGSALSISLSPVYPAPHQAVHLRAGSSILDLAESTLVWTVNGKVVAEGTGSDAIDITTGGLGSETDVAVQVDGGGGSASASARIIPTQVDLLLDSTSYVPPFYQGRALPSPGSTVVAQAIPFFVEPRGSQVAASALTYTWKRNGQLIASASGKGRSSAIFPAPVLYGHDTITVDIASSDGLLGGEASAVVAAADPVLTLYEDHPVFGILYGQALAALTTIGDSEMTFAAVPYFASVATPSDPALSYVWHVNGTAVQTASAAPNELTLSADPSNNQAQVQLELTHATNYFLDAAGSWNITLGSADATDQFHTGTQ